MWLWLWLWGCGGCGYGAVGVTVSGCCYQTPVQGYTAFSIAAFIIEIMHFTNDVILVETKVFIIIKVLQR